MRKQKDGYELSDEELLYLAAMENVEDNIRSGRNALNSQHDAFNSGQMLRQQQHDAMFMYMHQNQN